jgi:hypothetical protein
MITAMKTVSMSALVMNVLRSYGSPAELQNTTFIMICNRVFWTLFIVYILIKLLRFGGWIFFRLQVKRKDRNPGLNLAQPGGPTARIPVLPFYLKTEEDTASET